MAQSLTAAQLDLLAQLQGITNSSDRETDLQILQAANWDVQRAVQLIYDDGAAAAQPRASSSRGTYDDAGSSRRVAQLEVDDSAQGTFNGEPSRYRPISTAYPNTWTVGLNLFNILSLPFTLSLGLFSQLLHYVFRILGLPIPRFLRTSTAAVRGLPPTNDPMVAADRLVRQLEEETGAVCVSRVGLALQPDAIGSLNQLSDSDDMGKRKVLPDFWIGSYKGALEAAKRDIRILCVILMSEEHQDMPEFRHNVLTDPELVRVLTDNAILVWAGDIRDREAYQVAQSLQATTYPFIGFISLQPVSNRATSSSSAGATRLAVISRHEGSPSSSTSAPSLQAYITSTLLPRVNPLLTRLRNEQRTREAERLLREDQDRAFREAEMRDRERVERKRADERARLEEAERRLREAAEQAEQLEQKIQWRRWARRVLVAPDFKDGVRIGVRLPDGRRLVRNFSPDHTLLHLYAFVDVQSIPPSHSPESDPEHPPVGYEPDWDFQLASTYPRIEVPFKKLTPIRDVPVLRHGANLIAEIIRNKQVEEDEEEESDGDES